MFDIDISRMHQYNDRKINLLFYGDSLKVLQKLNENYNEKIKLIFSTQRFSFALSTNILYSIQAFCYQCYSLLAEDGLFFVIIHKKNFNDYAGILFNIFGESNLVHRFSLIECDGAFDGLLIAKNKRKHSYSINIFKDFTTKDIISELSALVKGKDGYNISNVLEFFSHNKYSFSQKCLSINNRYTNNIYISPAETEKIKRYKFLNTIDYQKANCIVFDQRIEKKKIEKKKTLLERLAGVCQSMYTKNYISQPLPPNA